LGLRSFRAERAISRVVFAIGRLRVAFVLLVRRRLILAFAWLIFCLWGTRRGTGTVHKRL
jgi:hypothetical protein